MEKTKKTGVQEPSVQIESGDDLYNRSLQETLKLAYHEAALYQASMEIRRKGFRRLAYQVKAVKSFVYVYICYGRENVFHAETESMIREYFKIYPYTKEGTKDDVNSTIESTTAGN